MAYNGTLFSDYDKEGKNGKGRDYILKGFGKSSNFITKEVDKLIKKHNIKISCYDELVGYREIDEMYSEGIYQRWYDAGGSKKLTKNAATNKVYKLVREKM
jgi:hypothetical protein